MNKETVETHGNIGSIGAFNNDQEKEVWVAALKHALETSGKGGRRGYPFEVADSAVLEFRSRANGIDIKAIVTREAQMHSQALIAAQDVMKAAGIDISMHPANAVGVLIEQRDEARAKAATLEAELAKLESAAIGPIVINGLSVIATEQVGRLVKETIKGAFDQCFAEDVSST